MSNLDRAIELEGARNIIDLIVQRQKEISFYSPFALSALTQHWHPKRWSLKPGDALLMWSSTSEWTAYVADW